MGCSENRDIFEGEPGTQISSNITSTTASGNQQIQTSIILTIAFVGHMARKNLTFPLLDYI